jgi:hypothetical protein
MSLFVVGLRTLDEEHRKIIDNSVDKIGLGKMLRGAMLADAQFPPSTGWTKVSFRGFTRTK